MLVGIERLVRDTKFYYIVATRFVNTKDSPHYKFIGWDGMMGAKSQELAPLVKDLADRVFDRSINSCFTEEFKEFLMEEGIEKLYFVGMDTDCCIMKSAFDAFDMKIPFQVLTSACASRGGESMHSAAWRIIQRNLGRDCVKEEQLC